MNREKSALFAIDLLCALLFSLAAGMVLFPALGWEVSTFMLALLTVLLLAVFATGSLRVWLPAALLLGGFGLPCLALVLFGRGGALLEWIVDFVPWCLGGMPESALYPQPWGRMLAAFWVLLPVVLLFWLLCHRFPAPWALSLLAVGFVCFGSFFGPGEVLAPFLLFAAGVIVSLPRMSLKDSRRLRAQGIALLFTLPVLGLSLLCGPAADEEWYSTGMRHLVQDVQDYWGYHWGPVQGFPATSMGRMGLMPLRGTLGGNIDPGDEILFLVDTETPFLLRGEAMEFYNGSTWTDAPQASAGSFRLESLLFRNERREAYGLWGPESVPAGSVGLFVDVDGEVISRVGNQALFLPYRTRSVEPGPTVTGDVYFDLQGETWLTAAPGSGYTFTLTAQPWNTVNYFFDSNVMDLVAAAPLEEDARLAEIESTCLQVPDTVPDWVRELCAELTEDCVTPYPKAMALRDYLEETCTYTLTPGDPDPEEDFVAAFLRDKQGYCTYYASALTVMCRLCGVPARYVTGYAMVYDPAMGRCVATQYTAHAWTEIYLAHIGWVPVDALTGTVFRIPEREFSSETKPARSPAPKPSVSPAPEEPLPEEMIAAAGRFDLTAAGIAALLLAAVGVFVALGMGYYPRRYRLETVLARHPDPADGAEFYYRAILRQLSLWDVEPQGGETLTGLLLRAEEAVGKSAGVTFEAVGRTMNRLRFGGYPPTEEEVRGMGEICQTLEAALKKRLGPGRYFVRGFLGRALFGGK